MFTVKPVKDVFIICVLKLCCMCVAGLISPWNLPLYLLTWKIAPAIAAGNTVVAKPSEMTSVTAWMMCKLMQQAGRTTTPTMQRKHMIIYSEVREIFS